MSFTVTPPAVREVWGRTVGQARTGVDDVRAELTGARGTDVGDLAPALARAVARLDGAAATAAALLEEFTTDMQDCLTTYARSEGHSAGVFNALAR